ncbi:MAG: ankyrin repeat domain-containing protein, partial [Xanthomonadales bacterium]|nr:ankyrin repeat domain-containing protein [Xanthomonadales bacterium]
LAELVGGADIDAPSSNGNRPLHLAVTAANLLLVQRLLELGAKPNVRNRQGLTPLHLAARNGAIDLAQTLLSARAKIDTRGSLQFIVQQFPTPLFLAIEARQTAMAAFLLQHGADPNLLCSGIGETALVMAARQGDAELVRMLLQHGALANGVDGGDGMPPATRPLEVAGSGAVARLLLTAGAQVDAANADGEWPAYWLAAAHPRDRPRLAALAWLLRAGADPLARTRNGCTPLQRVRSPDAMRLLRLAIVRWQRRYPQSRFSALQQARAALLSLCEEDGEAVRLAQLELLRMPHIDVRSRNQDGRTALQLLQRRQLGGEMDRDESRVLQRLIARLQWLEQAGEALSPT